MAEIGESKVAPGQWKQEGSVFWHNYGLECKAEKEVKVLGLDLDGTLIVTKSGKQHPTDIRDWTIWGNPIATLDTLRREARKYDLVVVVTNQKGISIGKVASEDFQEKMDAIQKKVDIPLQAFVLSGDDGYRKPCSLVWKLIFKLNKIISFDENASLFVGDAAGRPASAGRKKDFSAADLKFARNIEMPFNTPETFFLGAPLRVPASYEFEPKNIAKPGNVYSIDALPQEMVLMVGPPGSGKSFFSKTHFASHVRINRDSLHSETKCLTLCAKSLEQGKSVVIDNLNRTVKNRKQYLDLAKKHNCPARAVFLDVPKDFCFHGNLFRKIVKTKDEHNGLKIPDVVIHSFFKNLEHPTMNEGFKKIHVIKMENLVLGPFENKEDEMLYSQFLV